jgi:hypothetical protein
MKVKSYLTKILVIEAVLLIILPTLPVGLSSSSNFQEKQISSKPTTDHFTNSIIIIIGKCNVVQGPLIWIFGLYIPLIKRAFYIRADGGQGEQLNVIIRGSQFASYLDNENIMIDITGARGILFSGQKSILTNSTRIFARLKAENIWITHPLIN